jgi:threonine/homoserine/homoserine lactone efflux protein
MTLSSALFFTMGMVLLAISPGAGVAVVVSRTLGSGLYAGLCVMTGLIVGDLIFLGLAIVGLSAMASLMAPVFQFAKYAGGAYLIWLGYRTFTAAGAPIGPPTESARAAWREAGIGLSVTLGNPKPILFYGALMPTFIDVTKVGAGDYLILALIVAIVAYVVLGGYALAANKARCFMASARATRRLNQTTGAMLVGSGVLAAAR